MLHLLHILELYGFSEIESKGLLEATKQTECHIEIQDNASPIQELDSLNAALQKCYLRPDNTERQQLIDTINDPDARQKLFLLLAPFTKEFNDGSNIPTKLLLGASERTLTTRFQLLANYEMKGYHSSTIYLLGSDRELWIDSEPSTVPMLIHNLVTTKQITTSEAKEIINKATDTFFKDNTKNIYSKRAEIVKYFSDMGVTWPTEADLMYNMSISYTKNYPMFEDTTFIPINAPKKLNNKGILVRADTFDTYVQLWKDYSANISTTEPIGKVSLSIVTSQPYAVYQKNQAIAFFHDKPVNIFVISDSINDFRNLNILAALDSFARCIYASKEVVKAKLLAESDASEL